MIISHERRFIFIKAPRTAGSAVQHALVERLRDELVPAKDCADFARQSFWTGGPGGLWDNFWDDGAFDHSNARYIRRRMGEAIWTTYLAFAFVRNPWDANLSLYTFFRNGLVSRVVDAEPQRFANDPVGQMVREARTLAFPAFLRIQHARDVLEIVRGDDGRIAVDVLGRYEQLQPDLDAICDRLGIARVSLERVNASTHGPYREYYDDESMRAVALANAEAIDRFGYAF